MSFRFRHGDRLLDGYTIQRGVGRGAFGEVYYAISDGGREVALKTILQNQDIELRGVQHCINLKSPHLVSIFDVRTTSDGMPVVIMEYVAGPSLRDLLREHPAGMGPQRTAYLLRETAKGLTYLHEHGVVHRDLKPENLFYEDGYVKIGDYGLSKYVSASRQSGQTMSVGTVHYMAPEIGSGVYNQGIDIYALGVILHELLTGEVPFTGDSFGEILMKHLTAKPELDSVEEPFRSVIARALQKKQEERYASVQEMSRELFESAGVTESVDLFNPATLSVAVSRHATPPAGPVVSPSLKTSPVATPTTGDSPPLPEDRPPPPPKRSRIPSGWPPRPSTNTPPDVTAPSGSPDAATKRGDDVAVDPQPTEIRGRPAYPDREETPHEPHGKTSDAEIGAKDPLDHSQRMARAGFTLFVTAAGAVIVGLAENGLFGMVGLLLISVSSTAAIISTEKYFAHRFRIAEGYPRRLLIGALTFLPSGLGVAMLGPVRRPDAGFLGILLSLILLDWAKRMRPMREERLGWGDAFSAGLLAFFLGLLFGFGDGHAFISAVALSCVSLTVNAYSPWIPHEVRAWHRLSPAERHARQTAMAARDATERGAALEEPLAGSDDPAGIRADGAWSRVERARHSPRPELPPKPPGHVARITWLFGGAICLTAGLSSLVIPSAMTFRDPSDRLVFASVCLASIGYLGFCLYRGLWVRRRSPWARTVRPFLVTTLGISLAVCGYLFVMGPAEGAWERGDIPSFVSFICGLGSLLALLVLTAFHRLIGPGVSARVSTAHLPRPWQEVHPFLRAVELLLAALAGLTALWALSIGLFAHGLTEFDRAYVLAISLVSLVFGVYFAHQALRYRRGRFWESTLRPFLLALSTSACVTTGLFLLLRPEGSSSLALWIDGELPDETVIACKLLCTVAIIFGLFAFFVRGPSRELSQSRLCWWHVPPGEEPAPKVPGSGWSGLGTLAWILALATVVASAALRCGLAEALEIDRYVGQQNFETWRRALQPLWLSIGSALAGTYFVLISRRGNPVAHRGRAIFGQGCLLVAGGLFLAASEVLRVSNAAGQLVFHADGSVNRLVLLLNSVFAIGLVGTISLVWPRKRGSSEGPSEEDPDGTPDSPPQPTTMEL